MLLIGERFFGCLAVMGPPAVKESWFIVSLMMQPSSVKGAKASGAGAARLGSERGLQFDAGFRRFVPRQRLQDCGGVAGLQRGDAQAEAGEEAAMQYAFCVRQLRAVFLVCVAEPSPGVPRATSQA